MSNYNAKAIRPGGEYFEDVLMLDDFYGPHQYGVQFPDGKTYKEEECKFNEVEENEMEPFLKFLRELNNGK